MHYGPQASVAWVQGDNVNSLRHQARNEDRTTSWGWSHHDGRSFGMSRITDEPNNFVRPALGQRWLSQVHPAGASVALTSA